MIHPSCKLPSYVWQTEHQWGPVGLGLILNELSFLQDVLFQIIQSSNEHFQNTLSTWINIEPQWEKRKEGRKKRKEKRKEKKRKILTDIKNTLYHLHLREGGRHYPGFISVPMIKNKTRQENSDKSNFQKERVGGMEDDSAVKSTYCSCRDWIQFLAPTHD